jgi:HYR domain
VSWAGRRRGLLPFAGLGVLTVLLLATAAGAVPTLGLPGPIVAEATGASGATVTYTVTATDGAATGLQISCDGPGGGGATGTLTVTAAFPLGTTTITCSATNPADMSLASGSFTVLVQDTTPPVVTAPPDQTAEATDPAGAAVSFPAATAVDTVDGPVGAACAPPSGSVFALGSTTVSCEATDGSANTGLASFTVDVSDTTPPTLTVPAAIVVPASSAAGAPASSPAIAAFLAGATATDLADTAPSIANDAPVTFPVGTTAVTFTATDKSGNLATAASSVTVQPLPPAPPPPAPAQPPPATPPPPPPPPPRKPAERDTTPPSDVRNLKLKAGHRSVILTWRLPPESDFDHLRIARTSEDDGSAIVVYTGRGTRFQNIGLQNGVRYRYVVHTYDRAGNRSGGIAAFARPVRDLLLRPLDGVRTKSPPVFTWTRVRTASYYNLQLFRGGKKILTVWPRKNRFALKRAWRFAGRRYRLQPGAYRWFVWPGYGRPRQGKYGLPLGGRSFVVTRAG